MKDVKTLMTLASYRNGVSTYVERTNQISYFRHLQSLLDRFIGVLPGKRVLDIGFGSGRDIKYFLSKNLDVEGIELTREFIDILEKQIKAPLYLMDMRKLRFPSKSFDGIWSCASFLHIPKKHASATLKGFLKVLKPLGILALSLKEGEGEAWVSDENFGRLPRYFSYYKYEEMQGLLEVVGFDIVFEERQLSNNIKEPNWINFLCQKVV